MDFTQISINDPEWASELQIDLQEYMNRLYESVDAEEGTPEYEWGINTASGQPFCGCDVCQGREILSFVSGLVIQGYLDKKIELYSEESSSSEGGASSSSVGCRSTSLLDG